MALHDSALLCTGKQGYQEDCPADNLQRTFCTILCHRRGWPLRSVAAASCVFLDGACQTMCRLLHFGSEPTDQSLSNHVVLQLHQ